MGNGPQLHLIHATLIVSAGQRLIRSADPPEHEAKLLNTHAQMC